MFLRQQEHVISLSLRCWDLHLAWSISAWDQALAATQLQCRIMIMSAARHVYSYKKDKQVSKSFIPQSFYLVHPSSKSRIHQELDQTRLVSSSTLVKVCTVQLRAFLVTGPCPMKSPAKSCPVPKWFFLFWNLMNLDRTKTQKTLATCVCENVWNCFHPIKMPRKNAVYIDFKAVRSFALHLFKASFFGFSKNTTSENDCTLSHIEPKNWAGSRTSIGFWAPFLVHFRHQKGSSQFLPRRKFLRHAFQATQQRPLQARPWSHRHRALLQLLPLRTKR